MEQEKNDMLQNDLFEAKASFDYLISEMKEKGINFPYEETITLVEASYSNGFNAISRMNDYTSEYNFLYEENSEFFDHEAGIIIRGIVLYGITIIALKLFSKVLSAKQINEMWYLLIGALLGSVNTGMIFNGINQHRNGSKESRDLMNRLATLKEDYKKDYEIATDEIDFLFSINRNLWKILDGNKEKQIIKK